MADGEWVEVKKRLSVGDEREAFQAVIGEVNTEGWRRPNLKMMGLSEVGAYLVDWSFRDHNGQKIPATVDSLKSMLPADFKELEEAIQKHVAEVEQEDEARKNGQGGESRSEATSPSAA